MMKRIHKARVAMKTARDTPTTVKPRTIPTSNDMIRGAIKEDVTGMLKLKRHSNGLLDVRVSEGDPRNAIVMRNAEQSPLLRLPPEIRNRIFRAVVGDQEITIDEHHPFPKTTQSRAALTSRGSERRDLQGSSASKTDDTDNSGSSKFVHYRSTTPSTLFALTCRQIYAEVGLLPYTTNEWSFTSLAVFKAWLEARLRIQREDIARAWVQLEYRDLDVTTFRCISILGWHRNEFDWGYGIDRFRALFLQH